MKTSGRRKCALFAAIGCAAAAMAHGASAEVYSGGAPFQILNRSGLNAAQAKFYYLGFGQIGSDFVVLKADGNWASADTTETGWNANGWNQTPPAPQQPGQTGAGVVPCHQLTSSATINLPPNISGARVYFFQVNASSPLFSTPCANTASTTQTNGIFGNVLGASDGQAPFAFFSTQNGGDVVTPVPGWLVNGSMPIWSYSELGSGTGAGTIDTSQVDFIGFPVNVTAQMTALGDTYPVWNEGVGFSFSTRSQVNMSAVRASYLAFVNTLPASTGSGSYKSNVQSNFKKLLSKQGEVMVLFNPGNYIADINRQAFKNYFLNLIDNYLWNPGAWTGKLETGGQIPPGNGLPAATFEGTAVTLPPAGAAGAYPGYTGSTPLQAMRFKDPVTEAVAYVLSPVSYQVLCNAGAASAGCGSAAEQVFAASGALAQPGDDNQFALLSADEKAVWANYGGAGTYNQVVARLGLLISAAFNRGVAGGLQSEGGLCFGAATLNDCWNNQQLWYPTPRTAKGKRKFFGGDTSQNHFSRWLHTAQIPARPKGTCRKTSDKCIPMMTRPNNPTTLTSGAIMGMGYGFSNDENPTPQPAGSSQTPSKYDGIVQMSPAAGCNFITIMPWTAGGSNPTPVLSDACNPASQIATPK